jgi:hypothetical protein
MTDGTKNLILAILLVFALAAFLWPLAAGIYIEQRDRRKRGEPPEYDERQALARLRAGSHALSFLLCYLAVWGVMELAGWFAWTGIIPLMILCGCLLTLMVWAADCILHDAWTGWSQRKQNIQGVIFLIWGIQFVMQAPVQLRAGSAAWGIALIILGGGFCMLAGIAAYASRRQKLDEDTAP